MLRPQLLITKKNDLTCYCFCIQVDHFGPCETASWTEFMPSSQLCPHIDYKAKRLKWLLFMYTTRFVWPLWQEQHQDKSLSLQTCVSVITEVSSFHYILTFWRYFICKIGLGKGVRKFHHTVWKWDLLFSSTLWLSLACLPCSLTLSQEIFMTVIASAEKKTVSFPNRVTEL